MKPISRRTFIYRSAATLSLLQLRALTHGLIGGDAPWTKDNDISLYHLDHSGAGLYLHLVNTRTRHGRLEPAYKKAHCYLIVQLPPQSLHEPYFKTQLDGDKETVPEGQLQALLAGPSFLAFALWPEQEEGPRSMPFEMESLLDWEDTDRFRLLTAEDVDTWPTIACKLEYDKHRWKPEEVDKGVYDLCYYRALVARILSTRGDNYVTLFELPAGMLTVPINHARSLTHTDVRWTAIVRQNRPGRRASSIVERRYQMDRHGRSFVRHVRERWSAELEFQPPKTEVALDPSAPLPVRSLPPALRIIGLLARGDIGGEITPGQCAPEAATCPPCQDEPLLREKKGLVGYLPDLLDEAELLYLNQLGKAPYCYPEFDLQGSGPFRLTALGATLKFHYKNVNTLLVEDPSVSLVEYEHHFQDGRDNFIKVARIGVVSPLGTKALHVQIAQRKIDHGRVFLEYKEYIEFLERDKSYASDGEVGTGNPGRRDYCSYTMPGATGPLPPDCASHPNTRAWPFQRVEILVPRTSNMEPVERQGLGRSDFWVYREMGYQEPFKPSFANLVKVPVQYYDQNGKPVGAASYVPLLFFARNFFCSTTVNDWFIGANHLSSLQLNDDERLRVPTNGQVVALTPDEPAPKEENQPDPLANKVNQLATDWCEYQIAVATPLVKEDAATKSCSVFDVAEHVIYPQLRRAKVYLDHVQQYGGVKLPSVVEYEDCYLENGLTAAATARGGGNEVRVILRHTTDFIDGKLQDLQGKLLSEVGAFEGRWEDDLDRAWERIDGAFAAAGDRLGGMINPSPLLKRISTSKAALSLADGVQSLSRLDPQQMFGKLDAELFCGIRLKDILGLLDMESAPQYLLNKIPDELGDPQSALAAIGGNAVLQRAVAAVDSTAATVASLQQALDEATAKLEDVKGRFEALEGILRDQLPDYRKLLSAARLRFDSTRAAYRKEVTDLERPILAALETIKTLRELGLEQLDPLLAAFIRDHVAVLITNAAFTPVWAGLDLKDELDALLADKAKLETWATQVQTILADPNAVEEAKALLLKALLETPAAKAAADLFYERTKALTKLYDLVRERLEEKERKIWEAALVQIDHLRRTATAFYTAERERMEKQLTDVLRSSMIQIDDELERLNELERQGKAYTDKVLEDWGITIAEVKVALDLLRDPGKIQPYFEDARKKFEDAVIAAAKASPFYQELVARLDGYNALAQELLEKKKTFEQAGRDLVEVAQRKAQVVLRDLQNRFDEELAKVTDLKEVQDAREAYARLKQLLVAVKRQELVLDWYTEKFEQVDLGFIQFDPSNDPKTRLAMKVRGVMEMDPLRFPSAVLRTEVSIETRLSDFSINFFKIVGIRFGHVEFIAGTGRPADLDVQIDDVTFGGGLSFIQMLEDLLSGLVDGLRLEIRKLQVSVGFQTPSIDISSPGFTFSNFSVGMLLLIHFDRTPMRLRFDLAQAEKKATIAAGIYGGCFYCSLTLEPKRGIVAIEMALEMGAFIGISFGPFKGYVKFMVGLFYKKDDEGVVLEGYLIAEGLLSVWVVSVCARLYMGVRSQNSYVEGFCVASYSVKVGFLKKTFTAGYRKKVAGAASHAPNGSGGNRNIAPRPAAIPPTTARAFTSVLACLQAAHAEPDKYFAIGPGYDNYRTTRSSRSAEFKGIGIEQLMQDDFQQMTDEEFIGFALTYYAVASGKKHK